jgi:hypothetical protein
MTEKKVHHQNCGCLGIKESYKRLTPFERSFGGLAIVAFLSAAAMPVLVG